MTDTYMGNSSIENSLLQRYANALELEKKRTDEARHRRNVSAVTDFASNLISLIGRNKGARYSVATNNLPKYQNLYDSMRDRYNSAMLDYKAAIAENNLRRRIGDGNSVGTRQRQPRFIPRSGANADYNRLSSGTLENAVRNYYSGVR